MGSSISIVIPVFNQAHLTVRCLESVLKNSRIARELWVVDNHSTDHTSEVLQKFEALFVKAGWAFHVITNSNNEGFGRACNRGMRAAKGEFVAVLNNDTWLMEGWDEALLKKHERARRRHGGSLL